MEYSDKDMESLINEVETDFQDHLNKSEKTEDVVVVETASKTDEDTENTELTKSEDAPNEDTLDYDDEDMAEMGELYSSMTKAEAEAHYQAVKSVIFTEDENSENDSTDEAPAQMAKSEDSEDGDTVQVDTSDLQSQLDVSKKETEDLKKSFGDLVAMLHKNVKVETKAPQQKAITEIQYMAKSEDEVQNKKEDNDLDISNMTKSEATAVLMPKIRSNDLTKSDRERINSYFLSETNIDSIQDLIGG